MCGRFALDDKVNAQIEEYVAAGGDFRNWDPLWSIPPGSEIPILIQTAGDDGSVVKRAERAFWSIVPGNSPTLSTSKYPTFNARAEDVTERTLYKGLLPRRRAIIPATGYYEWQKQGTAKVPHFVHLDGYELLGFAGLYSWWREPEFRGDAENPGKGWHLTTTILTSSAVDNLVGIHDRNPVPLPREWWDTWLDPHTEGDQALVDAAVQAALPVASQLRIDRVAPLRGEGPGLITPVN